MKQTIIAAVALAALACGKETDGGAARKEPAAAPSPAAAPAAPPTAAAPTAPDPAAPADKPPDPAASAGSAEVPPEAAAVPDVPTTEDFEEKAASAVDKKNLEEEVSKMEKELGAKPKKK